MGEEDAGRFNSRPLTGMSTFCKMENYLLMVNFNEFKNNLFPPSSEKSGFSYVGMA